MQENEKETLNESTNTGAETEAVSTASDTQQDAASPNAPEKGQEPASHADDMAVQLNQLNEKYLRLYSEFDNFRKRTSREKLELTKTAGEDIFKSLLPVLDDFERAIRSMQEASEVSALKEGVDLIFQKFRSTLLMRGLEPMNALGTAFDPDLHEAITRIPVEGNEQKGKVVDELEKGYSLQGKVIRYAKVVVGS